MKNLIVETSTERGMVALLRDSELIYYQDLPFGLQNSAYLLPAIENALKEADITAAELDLITCGIGPGSYTGIRVGAMAAKTISYASKTPLAGICTLKCFVPSCDGSFAAVIDAKIGGVYLIKGVKTDEVVTYTSEPIACPLDKLWDHLQDVQLLVTPNSERLQPMFLDRFPDGCWEWIETSPCAFHMNMLGIDQQSLGFATNDGHLDLLYLRKTQAEIERELKQ